MPATMYRTSDEAAPSTAAHVGIGLLLGLGYAVLNTQTDVWAHEQLGAAFGAYHAFVDRGIPLVVGGLTGLALHWLRLRGRLARAEALRAEELRSRLRHVERDQAAWVVAAAALHELKNPLHALGLLVDELEHAISAGDLASARGEVEAVRRQLTSAVVPLDGLRAFTRVPRTPEALRCACETAKSVVATLVPMANARQIDLRFESDRSATRKVDADLLRIILDNLVVNALEGTAEGGRPSRVLVSMTHQRERLIVRVSDDGPGLPPGAIEALFEPLRSQKSQGLGLGLPIARVLARSLGGELAPVELSGFTTSFELALPLE